METNLEQVLDKLAEHVKGIASTETVVGDEFTIGEFTCKPVMKVGLGFGSGIGEGDDKRKCKGHGQGAGAGIGMAPIGFLVTRGGEISFIPSDQKKGLQAIFEKVPDLLEKVMEMKKEKEDKEESKKEKNK